MGKGLSSICPLAAKLQVEKRAWRGRVDEKFLPQVFCIKLVIGQYLY
ncbi:hypothetical protein KKC1_32680 [Calderihabitans maritimus]|uniref:Uncharacterized protein n=1 Tax=Calderihabitans maritimus TaxID=1246530 RepID=A0A1Z5HXW1_9FIRM|nr:hypothetical protein KKC1_32680 [Calderihabitans maritimus]